MGIDHYINEIKTTWDGEPWYGVSFKKTLDDVEPETVHFKVEGFSHSIVELVDHINAWRNYLLKKLKGDQSFEITLNDQVDWRPDAEKVSWDEIVKETNDLQNELVTTLSSNDNTILETNVPGKKYSFEQLIQGTCQHDIYHLGQIRQLYAHFRSK